jgi:ferredoxin
VLAPEVFGEDDRGHCVVLAAEVSGTLADEARKGESNCPEAAIRVDAE